MSKLYVNKKRNRELYKINKKKVRKKATDFASNIFFYQTYMVYLAEIFNILLAQNIV